MDESGRQTPLHEPGSVARRAATAGLALLLSAASLAVMWSAFDGHSADRQTRGPSTAAAEPTVRTIDIGHGGGIDLEVGGGSVWVTTSDAVLELDPATNEVVREIPMDGAFRLAIGEGAVWVTDIAYQGKLVRIDPDTGAATAALDFPSLSPHGVDVAGGSVWVTASGSNGGDLIRIDAATNEVVASIHIAPGSGAGGLGSVVADEDAVWVTRGGDSDSLLRIDPDTNEIVSVIDIANTHYWNEMVLENDSLWVVSTGPRVTFEDGTHTNEVVVLRIDKVTGDVVDAIPVGHGMFGMGAGEGSLWVYDGFHPSELTHVDATTGAIVRRVPIPDGGSSWGGDPGIDAANGTVWMAGVTSLIRIDLEPAATA
ncbi:MAG: hypothetical protein ACRDGW_12230 [Actinomycetota bacterium]